MIEQLKILIGNRDNSGVIKLLDEFPDILDMKDDSGVSGFLNIAYCGMQDVFEKAIELKKEFSFHEAIVGGQIDVVKDYLKEEPSARVNEFSGDGFSPVALAAFFNRDEIAKLLIGLGADINAGATNPSKVNALHAAVAKDNLVLCRFLIENGANVNATQIRDVTPLHAAAHKGNLELTKLLVENGAVVDVKMENGDTPLMFAERDGHQEVFDYLIGLGG